MKFNLGIDETLAGLKRGAERFGTAAAARVARRFGVRKNASNGFAPKEPEPYGAGMGGATTQQTGDRINAEPARDRNGKHGYIGLYKGKQYEVYADSSYGAQKKLAAQLGARKESDVDVFLAEKDVDPGTGKGTQATTSLDNASIKDLREGMEVVTPNGRAVVVDVGADTGNVSVRPGSGGALEVYAASELRVGRLNADKPYFCAQCDFSSPDFASAHAHIAATGHALAPEHRDVKNAAVDAFNKRMVCPNCDQWAGPNKSLGYYDCFNECARRGFADRVPLMGFDERANAGTVKITLNVSEYEVETMDPTHVRMRLAGTEKWGIPQHVEQLQPAAVSQLQDLGAMDERRYMKNSLRNAAPKSITYKGKTFKTDDPYELAGEMMELDRAPEGDEGVADQYFQKAERLIKELGNEGAPSSGAVDSSALGFESKQKTTTGPKNPPETDEERKRRLKDRIEDPRKNADIGGKPVLKVYSGKDGACMCGCSGTYWTSGPMMDRISKIVAAAPDDFGNGASAVVGDKIYAAYYENSKASRHNTEGDPRRLAGWGSGIVEAYQAGLADARAGKPKDLAHGNGYDASYSEGYEHGSAKQNAGEMLSKCPGCGHESPDAWDGKCEGCGLEAEHDLGGSLARVTGRENAPDDDKYRCPKCDSANIKKPVTSVITCYDCGKWSHTPGKSGESIVEEKSSVSNGSGDPCDECGRDVFTDRVYTHRDGEKVIQYLCTKCCDKAKDDGVFGGLANRKNIGGDNLRCEGCGKILSEAEVDEAVAAGSTECAKCRGFSAVVEKKTKFEQRSNALFQFVDGAGEREEVEAADERAAWDGLAEVMATTVEEMRAMGVRLENSGATFWPASDLARCRDCGDLGQVDRATNECKKCFAKKNPARENAGPVSVHCDKCDRLTRHEEHGEGDRTCTECGTRSVYRDGQWEAQNAGHFSSEFWDREPDESRCRMLTQAGCDVGLSPMRYADLSEDVRVALQHVHDKNEIGAFSNAAAGKPGEPCQLGCGGKLEQSPNGVACPACEPSQFEKRNASVECSRCHGRGGEPGGGDQQPCSACKGAGRLERLNAGMTKAEYETLFSRLEKAVARGDLTRSQQEAQLDAAFERMSKADRDSYENAVTDIKAEWDALSGPTRAQILRKYGTPDMTQWASGPWEETTPEIKSAFAKAFKVENRNSFKAGCGCGHQYDDHHPGEGGAFPCGLCKCETYHKVPGQELQLGRQNAPGNAYWDAMSPSKRRRWLELAQVQESSYPGLKWADLPQAVAQKLGKAGSDHRDDEIFQTENSVRNAGSRTYVFVDKVPGEGFAGPGWDRKVTASSESEAWDRVAQDHATSVEEFKKTMKISKVLAEVDRDNAGVVHFTFGSGTERQAACGGYVAFGDKHAALKDVTCKACLEDLSGEKQNSLLRNGVAAGAAKYGKGK